MREEGTILGEIERGWQRFWGLSWRWKGPIIGVVAIVLLGTIASIFGGGDEDESAFLGFFDSPDGGSEVDDKATSTSSRETYSPKGDAKAYLLQGLDFGEAGQYVRAIEAFDEAIRIDPTYAWAYNNRGVAYVELGLDRFDVDLYGPAMEDFNEAIRIDPLIATFYANRGGLHSRFLRIDKAIENYDEAIRIDPNEPEYYNLRGYIYDHKTILNTDQAVRDYDEAIRLDPNEARYHFNRGNALYGAQQWYMAIDSYDEALRLDPQNSHYYHNKEMTLDEISGRPHSNLWDD